MHAPGLIVRKSGLQMCNGNVLKFGVFLLKLLGTMFLTHPFFYIWLPVKITVHREWTKSKKEQGDWLTGWQTDGQVCYTSSQKITITSSKLLSIPINSTWKAHGPGSMPLVRFPKHSVWTVVSVASHKGIQGRVGFQTPSHWSQKMPHHHFPALSCGTCAAPGEGLPTP